MASPDREGKISENMAAMLFAELPSYISIVDPTISMPDSTHGYSDDVTFSPRDENNYIAVWCDSIKHMRYHSCGYKDDFVKIGVEWTFNTPLHVLGRAKRNRGVAIRKCIEDFQKSTYFGEVGIYRMTIETDYRYASKRQSGGARRGLQGKTTSTGNCIDSVVLGVNCWMRTTINVQYPE